MSPPCRLVIGLLSLAFYACHGEPDRDPKTEASGVRGDLPKLCRHAGDDLVRDLFCGESAPAIQSLGDLQQHLGLIEPGILGAVSETPLMPGATRIPQVAVTLLNHSTSLSGKLVSTLNPRALVLGREVTLAFNRGVQQVELLSRDRSDNHLNFYLIRFEQACNAHDAGCSPGDLFTPRVESDWDNLRIDDDETLANTPFDCRQCHQRARPAAIMLMRELRGPWTHFFGPSENIARPGPEATGVHITRAYNQAKGDEPYANIRSEAIRSSVGFALEAVVELPQPLVFDGEQVLRERWPLDAEERYAEAPAKSPTWYGHYEAFKRGEQLAMPHFDPFPSDPAKLAALSETYQRFIAGEIGAEELPDLSDVYPDDPQTLAEIGFQTERAATPAQTLVQACGQCHNDVLDQSLSRARFNIDLTRMDRAALAGAIARVSLPLDAPGHMPPAEFRQVHPDALEPLVRFLEADVRSAEDEELLQRAAQLGMANEVGSVDYIEP